LGLTHGLEGQGYGSFALEKEPKLSVKSSSKMTLPLDRSFAAPKSVTLAPLERSSPTFPSYFPDIGKNMVLAKYKGFEEGW
jgi:hypothetical protein